MVEPSEAVGQALSESAIALQMPLPAHRFAARVICFGIDETPDAPACRAGAVALVVAREAAFEIGRPADIGAHARLDRSGEHVDEAAHGCQVSCDRRGLRIWRATPFLRAGARSAIHPPLKTTARDRRAS